MNLSDRQKRYEKVSQTYLMRKTPVIIRLDGVAFHTFTRNFDKPVDDVLASTMCATTRYLVENIQGCIMGYTQSDEISLVLQDYRKIDTDAWFGYNVQKLVSVSANMATERFNRFFDKFARDVDPVKYATVYHLAQLSNNPGFDSRCWNLPFDEVNNYMIFRQIDAERNSINLLGQQYYTQEELQGIKAKDLQNKIFTEHGVNWNDLSDYQKRGYVYVPKKDPNTPITTPIFSKDPDFVNSRVYLRYE